MVDMELRPEDRGWNDPPIVNFSEGNQSHRRGMLLNKRVAFPIHGSSGVPAMGAGYPSLQPSMQQSPMPVQVGQESYMYSSQEGPGGTSYYPQSTGSYYPQQPQLDEYPQPHQSATFITSGPVEQPQRIEYHQQNVHQTAHLVANTSMLQLDESLRNFHEVMNNLSPQVLNKDEVSRLFEIMQSMWREHKLPPEVCEMIFQVSVALRRGDGNYAESLLSSLSVNHLDSCHEWISGPRAMLQALSFQQAGN